MSFHAQKQADIAHMVSTLKASQMRLEEKGLNIDPLEKLASKLKRFLSIRTPRASMRLFPGQKQTIKLAQVKLGTSKLRVIAPKHVRYYCTVEYYDFRSGQPVRHQKTFSEQEEEYLLERGEPRSFNPLSPEGWKRFPEDLIIDSTLVTITHRKYDNKVIDDLPQRQASFTIAVS